MEEDDFLATKEECTGLNPKAVVAEDTARQRAADLLNFIWCSLAAMDRLSKGVN